MEKFMSMNTNIRRLTIISVITVFAAFSVLAIAWLILFYNVALPPSALPSKYLVKIPPGAIEKEGTITPEEAVSEARKTPGFENGAISQVEALLNDKGEIRYWVIKTKNGTITVFAEPPPPKVVIPPNTAIDPETTITPLEAVRRVRKIKGYENEEILEVFGLVDEKGNLQYWSVKTSKGFVTIDARR